MDVIDRKAWTGKVHAGALTWLVEHPVPSQVSLRGKRGMLVVVKDDMKMNEEECYVHDLLYTHVGELQCSHTHTRHTQHM